MIFSNLLVRILSLRSWLFSHSLFLFLGPVKKARILTDKESGKSKGFAFVEFYDANTALSAIKHLDQTELNGRKIKVGFPEKRYITIVSLAYLSHVFSFGFF
jgi:cleavage stimulation factor subunit 2